jgi:ABC-2 type transport system permease protein
MKALRELVQSRELLFNLTLRELRGKYKRSVLGWAWSLINPLATMAIFTLVFLVFLKVDAPPGDPSGLDSFPLYLLCALLPWNLLANGMGGGLISLLANGNLIKKVYFPRESLVAATVVACLVSCAVEMAVLAVVLLIVGNMVLPWLPLVALTLVMQTLFVLGIALALSVLNVYFRDMQYLVGILTQLWFYATPIVYPITLVPEHHEVLGWDVPLRAMYELNPMVGFVTIYRNLLYDLRFPGLGDVVYVTIFSLVTLVLGYLVFQRLESRLAEEL